MRNEVIQVTKIPARTLLGVVLLYEMGPMMERRRSMAMARWCRRELMQPHVAVVAHN
jgi:hypothetical protein